MFKKGVQQSLRAPLKLLVYFFVTAMVCAFLCIGLNLKKAADDNLTAVLEGFNVVALPDFKANLDEWGNLTASLQDSVGHVSCKAENYEIGKLLELPGVLQVDARNQFGACVNGLDGKLYQTRCTHQTALRYMSGMDVVIFQLDSSTPVEVTGYKEYATATGRMWKAEQINLPIKLLWSATGRIELSNLNIQNPSFKRTYHLEPGKTYIINMGASGNLVTDIYHQAYAVQVSVRGAYSMKEPFDQAVEPQYPAITEYYEGFWDTDMGLYYWQSAQACYLAGNSLTAITTGDLSMIPSWASGEVYLRNGRLFSQEDYQNGSQVCIISQHLLEKMGWKIGDTIDLSFYQTRYILSPTIKNQYSTFDPYLYNSHKAVSVGESDTLPMEQIFHQNTYTIIGTYDGKVCWRSEHESYLFNESMHWLMVLLPETAVQNQPSVKLSQYHTTIRIEPLMIQKFLAAVQSSGLMEEQSYGYQLGLTIDDHGLSGMVSGLEALQQISRLTLVLSSVTAVLAVLVLAILHLLQNRKQIAILRSMGVKKWQTVVCILSGILLVSFMGAVAGGLMGEKLSVSVTEQILHTAQEDDMDADFSAVTVIGSTGEETFELNATADRKQTVIAVGAVFGALLILSAGVVLWEANKQPLLMLGVKE